MNAIPNVLTGARLAVVPVLLALMYVEKGTSAAVAAIFIAASVTDWFDGWLARKLGVVSRWGKVIDPLADRLLVNGAILMLTFYDDRIAGWEIALVVVRDAVATWGFWKFRGAHQVLNVIFAGKASMFLMMAGLAGTLLFPDPLWPVRLFQVGLVLSALVMADYVWKYRKLLCGPRQAVIEAADLAQARNEA
jgi:CDP-diacylglycerol--glycerol-3-phosphate 3-phosphatidyltransferase